MSLFIGPSPLYDSAALWCTFRTNKLMAKTCVGTSGWNYKHWGNDEFYPRDLQSPEWLRFFVRHFDTVELNNSFYRLPSEAAFQNWRIQVPPHFVFSVKASHVAGSCGFRLPS